MAAWAFKCVNCGKDFGHSAIAFTDAVSYVFPLKPSHEPTELKCPHCGHKAVYKQSDYVYRH
jgi:DNA-directed RNA polymerase subunit RPC12/RpoP